MLWGKSSKGRSKALSLLSTIISFIFVGLNPAMAQDEQPSSIDAAMASVLSPIADNLSSFVFYKVQIAGAEVSILVVWMAVAMLFLTVYFKFINLRGFGIAKDILMGRYRDDNAPGDVTQFQALSTALSGTVGIGNIAGVGAALAIGGPGATFWMIIIGLCAMSVKFAECTLGVKYREFDDDGSVSGGPMYYLKNGLAAQGKKRLGLVLALCYGAFGIPTIIQWATVNQVYAQVNTVLPMDGWVFGVIIAFLTGVVIIGGIREIVQVTSRLVPFMVTIYLGAALFILITNITEIPMAFYTIFHLAFSPDSVAGGILGVIMIGMRRAVYSTEAGLGTSSMVHAAAKTNEPVSEGMVALMEPFIDTVIVCTITALVIVISGQYTDSSLQGITLTSAAFESSISFFPYILAFSVFLFGFSTLISWAYYCEKIWTFVLGRTNTSKRVYKFVFIALLIPGGVFTTKQVFDIIDSLFFLLTVPNIIGLYILAPEVKADLERYLRKLKDGRIQKNQPDQA